MKYADYRKEDLVFLTKENWTDEEKMEVLNTFPESCETEQIRKALNKVIEAIEDGTIKCSNYNYINKQSAKAYANKHDYLRYGRPENRWYGTDKYFYIVIDGTYKTLNSKWHVEEAIEYLDDVDKRFTNIIHKYREAEERYKKETETQNYEDENRDRIIANRIADCYLSEFEIQILSTFENYRYSDEQIPQYSKTRKNVRGSSYTYHNKYDEITFYGKVCSKEDAEKIIEIMKEANRKAEMIMDRVDIELREIKEKYREDL